MSGPARGVLIAGGLLLAAAALTGGTAVTSVHRTGVSVSEPQATGLVFVTNQEFGLLTSRRYDEGPGGPVTPPSLLRANQRDSAYGSSLTLGPEPPRPAVPPGGPAVLGVAALLLGLAAVLGRRRWALVPAAAGGGVLGAVTVLVGLTGGPVLVLVVACGLVLGGGLLLHRRPAGAG